MQEVRYRPAREYEVAEAVQVFLTAVADMYARTGVTGTPLPPREAVEANYRHIFRTGIFHLAEVGGRVGAICHAVVRGPLWFLSGFWALPELQQKRVGGALLRGVWGEGARAGAQVFFTWSSVDTTAMASYMRMGMLPGYPVLTFAGGPKDLPGETSGYEARPLAVADAARIDEQVRARGREVDHEFWLSTSGHQGGLVRRGARVAGYFYVHNGTVGPAAWTGDDDAEALMTLALREAAGQSGQVRLMAPGINHAAIRFALRAGLRFASFSHLLTTSPFGRLEQYLASGPSLF